MHVWIDERIIRFAYENVPLNNLTTAKRILYLTQPNNKMDPIRVFPAEIISDLILPYLDLAELCTLRGVSRAWQDFVNEHFAIIKRLDLTDVLDLISEVGCQSIFKHLLKLQDVCLDKCWRIATKNNLITLLRNCSDLRSYSSRRCKHVDDEVLELMARNCSKLESVDISHCFQVM